MSRVIIDTNILYSITGISVNDKVSNSRILDYKLSITTASLIESIAKFRSCLPSIQKCLKPITSGKIELISIGHAPLQSEVIYRLSNANDIKEVESEIAQILDFKISRESEFFRFLLIVVACGIFEILKTDGYGFTDPKKDKQQIILVRALLESNMDLVLDFFKTELRKGYDDDNEQRAALNAFNEMLLMLMKIFHFNYHQIKTEILQHPQNDLSVTPEQTLIDSLNSDNFYSVIKKNLENPIALVSQKKNTSKIDWFISEIKEGISGLDSLTEKSLSFMMHKVENGYKHQAKIRKNDIFDFFIVFSLNLENTKIATLDKAFAKLLSKVDSESYHFCQELGFIS